jgi:hypothetical protein
MAENTRSCQVKVSTIFVFDSPQVQNASNAIYEYVKQFSTTQAANGKTRQYQFKTDFERMQYLLGLYGRTSEGRR